jgi:hypothetical protein
MANKVLSLYEKLVFVAYGYYILLALSWLLANLVFGGYFNPWASGTILVFGAQAYFRKRVTNLILGVLAFGISIFWTLEFVYLGRATGYDLFVKVMLGLALISIIMAGILIFSFTKLSFKDQEQLS